MRTPIVFVGAATYDAISLVPTYPGTDDRVEATDVVFAGGGPAATAAVAAQRIGIEVTLIAQVGEDDVGALITAGLEQNGISTAHLQRVREHKSQSSVVVCSTDNSTRAISTVSAEPLALTAENAEIVRNAHWVHVDHLGWPAVEVALVDVAAADRPKISVDAGHKSIGDDKSCDPAQVALYVPPFDQLPHRPQQSDYDVLRAVGADTVVATMGSDGAVGLAVDGAYCVESGHRIEELGSTLGAGDVFHGALVAAIASGNTLSTAIRFANAVASLSCRGIDGRSRIPTREEADRFLAKTSTQPANKEILE